MTEKKEPGPEAIFREIKRNTRHKFNSEEKILGETYLKYERFKKSQNGLP
jgi:hypothetical protein